MISTVKLLRAFNGDHIADVFHYADHFLLSHGVRADRTYISIGDIATALAKFDFLPHLNNILSKRANTAGILL